MRSKTLGGHTGRKPTVGKNFQQLLQADNSRTMRTADNLEKKTKKIATYLQIIMDETRRLNNLVTQLLGVPQACHTGKDSISTNPCSTPSP